MESCNLPGAHFTRVPVVVNEAEAPHPVAVGLLRPHAIVLEPDAVTELIEQQQLRRSGERIDAIAGSFSGRAHGVPHCSVWKFLCCHTYARHGDAKRCVNWDRYISLGIGNPMTPELIIGAVIVGVVVLSLVGKLIPK